jgi:shikimate dehydrogenase
MEAQSFPLLGVMGWPVMHSRSPMMHNLWFQQTGLPGTYVFLPIPPERLASALRALPALNFAGCNLTIPHKQAAMAVLDEVDPVARKIGAISCVVVRKDGSLYGTNNDWLGFLGNLRQTVPGWRAGAGPAVVLGAGGASRAVVHALVSAGVPEVRLVNRTVERAEALAGALGGPVRTLGWDDREAALDGAAILVNCTSLGMKGQPPLDMSLDGLSREAVVCDIVYTPLVTGLLAAAKARGNPVVGGLGMLLHQGPPAWKLWFGVEPKVTPELVRAMEVSLTA